MRTDEGDAGISFSCLVENSLTGNEESSPPYHLTLDSKIFSIIFKMERISNTYYLVTDTGMTTKPKELMHQDLYYSYDQGNTGVLACNVQSNPPPAFR